MGGITRGYEGGYQELRLGLHMARRIRFVARGCIFLGGEISKSVSFTDLLVFDQLPPKPYINPIEPHTHFIALVIYDPVLASLAATCIEPHTNYVILTPYVLYSLIQPPGNKGITRTTMRVVNLLAKSAMRPSKCLIPGVKTVFLLYGF